MIRAHAALFLCAAIYGLFYVLLKQVIAEVGPWEVFFLRLSLAMPLFFVLEKAFCKTNVQSTRDALKIAGLGLLGVTLVQLTIIEGVKRTSVFHTGFIAGTAPVITLALSLALGREKLTIHKALGIAVALLGLVLLLTARNANAPLPPDYLLGDFLILGNIFCWAWYLLLSRPMLDTYNSFSLTAYVFMFAALLSLPFAVFQLHGIPGAHLSVAGWQRLAFLVLLGTIATYSLNFYGLARLSASTVAVYILLQPIMTSIAGYFLLHEPVTWAMLADGAIILLGVAIAGRLIPMPKRISH